MSLRTRGQEATLRVTVDGETQDGSWFKVKDFTATPREDIIEEDYLGELESDLDYAENDVDEIRSNMDDARRLITVEEED